MRSRVTKLAAVNFMRAVLFAAVAGSIAALAAIGFVDAVVALNKLFGIARAGELSWLIILTPAAGGLAVGLLLRFIPGRWPYNPAEIIAAAQTDTVVPVKSGMLTALAALVGLGCGASVGQYGPLAHLGATLGAALQKFARVDPRLALGCGVAAAVAAAFNAPLGGILFAHEVILRRYSLRTLAPITTAAGVAIYLAAEVLQRPPIFEIALQRAILPAELVGVICIGIGGGLLAIIFMHAILYARRLGDALRLPGWLKPCVAGLGVGLAAIWWPEILGDGGETLRLVITAGEYTAAELGWVLIAKLLATALCLGFGFAGGVVNPALLLGILFGALVGTFATELVGGDAQTVILYGVCAMAAVTSPVIGAPLTVIFFIFELTRNYELTAAVILSAPLASCIGYKLFGRSLFDRQLSLRGFAIAAAKKSA